MKTYDTLLLGSGFFSVGYAAAREGCLIAEEEQICDTHFYLPLRSFRHHPYAAVTEEGAYLAKILEELALLRDGQMNTNALEIALCRYLTERPQELLLKCRAVRVLPAEEGYTVTLSTNEGLLTVGARRVIDTRAHSEGGRLTVLLTTKTPAEDTRLLEEAFGEGCTEPAFYEDRLALHLPAEGRNATEAAEAAVAVLRTLPLSGKVLYIPPALSYPGTGNRRTDDDFESPIEAFERGFLYAKEVEA